MGHNGPPPNSPEWLADRAYRRSFKGRMHAVLSYVFIIGMVIMWAKGCAMMQSDIKKILTHEGAKDE